MADGSSSDWLKEMRQKEIDRHNARKVTIPEGSSGAWRIERFEVPEVSITNMRLAMEGRGVLPGTYTRLVGPCPGGVMMSDTPAEYADFAGFLRIAAGDILVTGLGIGMTLKALLAKPEVTSIVVVEHSPDIIKLVAPHYDDPRLTIVEHDAYTWRGWTPGQFDLAWHDIWPTISEDNLPEFGRMRRNYIKAMRAPKAQHCWCEERIRRDKRRESRSYW